MNDKRLVHFVILLLVAAFLSACSAATAPATVDETGPEAVVGQASEGGQASWPAGQRQQDEQGQISVTITPLGRSAGGATLDFEVTLNTHSVELDMDLALLATLANDNGLVAQATGWDAPRGGHHVTGILSFPAIVDGGSLLDGARQMALVIRDVDVAERRFTWQLGG